MKRSLNYGIVNPCALVMMQVLLACGAADQGPTSDRSSGSDRTTTSTNLPGEGDADEAVNPQRNPEQWERPGDAPSGGDETPPGQKPPANEPPANEPPANEPPATEPPASEPPPATEPPASEPPPATEPPAQPPSPPAPEPSPYAKPGVPFRGVNLAGAEFGSALPGAFGKDYTFPTRTEVDYYMGKGMNTFRVGFKWERLQPAQRSAFDGAYFERLDGIVSYATSKGASVILNPHNFARYYGDTVGSSKVPDATFADLWRRLAEKYKGNSKVLFNLVNEPHDINTEQWVGAANAAIGAIRQAGANNLIVVPGNGWTGAHSWNSTYYGTPNSKAMLKITDPKDNIVFEVHQYMDTDSSGSSGNCVSTTVGRERLEGFVKWLRDNKKKGFLGEFAGGNNSTCNTAVKNMLDYVHGASDVMVGWTWWAGGPWWGEYKFTLHPKNGADRPQMALLTPYLKK